MGAASGMSGQVPSNRSFGWLFTVVFTLVGSYSLWQHGSLYPWAFGLAGLTAAVTLIKPDWLAPLNRLWMRFGELLHRIVSPVILGLIFYAVFTPVAFVMRIAGRDAMKRQFEPGSSTYWIDRDPPGPAADSFKNQF
jgi:hypothetical protein